MKSGFDSTAFIAHVGHRLVRHFEEARQATTPSLVGTAIEAPVRKELEQILPRGIAVGSGCIIDSYGSSSKQQDVVLYERDICPVFSVNDTPESTYYPCEGVIGVVEVKSSIGSTDLQDSFKKIESVRRLRRYEVHDSLSKPDEPLISYRHYGSIQAPSIMSFDLYRESDQLGLTQIFGAVLTNQLRLRPDTFRTKYAELSGNFGDDCSPNMIEVLGGGTLIPFGLDGNEGRVQFSAKTATHFMYSESDPFRHLLHGIYLAHRHGLTSPTEVFDRYLIGEDPNYFGLVVPKTV